MWFGTQDGINRFDGRNFINISPFISDDSSNIADFGRFSKMVTALYADDNDWLWVGTTQEIALYNRYTNKFILVNDIYKGFVLPKDMWIKKITGDKTSNIWILTQNGGLFCYNRKLGKMISFNWPPGVAGKINLFCSEDAGNVWAGSETELYQLKGRNFLPVGLQKKLGSHIIVMADIALVNHQPWCIINGAEIAMLQTGDKEQYRVSFFAETFKGKKFLTDARLIHQSDANTVWIGSRSEGLIKANIAAKAFENAAASGSGYALKKQFILSFFTNRQQITWIGLSGGGIAKYDLQKVQFGLWRNETLPGMPSPDNMMLSVFSDNDTDFYMGTLYAGLLHINIQTGTRTYYQPPVYQYDATGSKNIYNIIAGENNLLWMATWGGLYSFDKITKQFARYSNPADEQTKELCALVKLRHENVLLTGGYRGGLRLFNLHTKKWEKCRDEDKILDKRMLRVRYMQESDDGNIYMSTEAQNLVRYNYVTGTFTFFPGLQRISGVSRYFAFDGAYTWIATDDGLIQADKTTMQIIKVWNTANLLPNNVIYAVMPDNYGRVWISSNAGLSLLDYRAGICKNFTEDDGLQGMEFNTASCYSDKKGRLWFGGVNGLNMVNPDLSAGNQYAPAPLITSISVMNSPYHTDTALPYLHTITLPYAKNFISFEFQSPDFSQSENIIYQYQLKGVDTGWVNNGTRNYVSYTQLNPGHYTLYLRSANNNGVWSRKAAALSITITPPWFKTWWFYTALVLITAWAIYLLFRYRLNQVRKVERMRQHISADLHDDIGASLTSINILSQLSQQQKIDNTTRNEYLQKINEQTADVTDALRDIVWSINPKNDRLDIILARMKRYAAELLESKHITYRFETNIGSAGETLDAGIRQNFYLVFKEAVNNLAKYSGATDVIIKVTKQPSILNLFIADNGQGFDAINIVKGNGIDNMQKRAEAMEAKLHVDSTPGGGTVITLQVPI